MLDEGWWRLTVSQVSMIHPGIPSPCYSISYSEYLHSMARTFESVTLPRHSIYSPFPSDAMLCPFSI